MKGGWKKDLLKRQTRKGGTESYRSFIHCMDDEVIHQYNPFSFILSLHACSFLLSILLLLHVLVHILKGINTFAGEFTYHNGLLIDKLIHK